MSEENATPENVTTPDAPKQKKARASKKLVPFSSCHVAYAKRAGMDTTRAAKQNRNYVRSNFDTLVRLWPALKSAGKNNRDGNRYPSDIPSDVAAMIVARKLPTAKAGK